MTQSLEVQPTSTTTIGWVVTPYAGQGRASGGSMAAELFEAASSRSSQRRMVESLVRELCQNVRDQRLADHDEPAEAVFDLFKLEGDRLQKFLEAMDWPTLSQHISSLDSYSSTATTLKRIASAIEDGASLTCLRVSDYGTYGLTGEDADEDGNFRRLCVQNFMTSDQQGRGGSYGLGKAVSWLHSELLTVLFSSRIQGDQGKRLRLFGRAELPAHELEDGRRFLDGAYFGQHGLEKGVSRAESVWDDQELAEALCLERRRAETGTSLLIPAFSELDTDQGEGSRSLIAIAEDILAAAEKWFWPALRQGDLIVDVRVLDGPDGRPQFSRMASPEDCWMPFIRAAEASVSTERVVRPGQSSAIAVPFPIPERIQPIHRAHTAVETRFRLGVSRCLKSEMSAVPLPNHIALVRGAGMVVEYVDCPPPTDGLPWCSVLSAGLAAGDSLDCFLAEEYLRAAEPVAHDCWDPRTRSVREFYRRRGSSGRLRGLKAELRELVSGRLLGEAQAREEEGPRLLSRLFSVSASGLGAKSTSISARPVIELEPEDCEFLEEEKAWVIAGTCRQSTKTETSWQASVSFASLVDSGSGSIWSIEAVETIPSVNAYVEENRRIRFAAPAEVAHFSFQCRLLPPTDVDPQLTGFRLLG